MGEKDDYKNQVIGETYEDGSPTDADAWRKKVTDRGDMLKYLKSSERYWCLNQDEWFGSEKRKNKA